jgi:hypothetical protein
MTPPTPVVDALPEIGAHPGDWIIERPHCPDHPYALVRLIRKDDAERAGIVISRPCASGEVTQPAQPAPPRPPRPAVAHLTLVR